MSMLAHFVQVDADLLGRIGEKPSLAERLFQPDLPAAAFDPERMRAAFLARGPQLLAGTIDLHPALRSQIEASVGRTYEALQRGEGGDALFALMQERLGRRNSGSVEGAYESLSLDKAWHGVHYLLAGAVEPTDALASQAVLGGTEIGADFAGYGPARCLDATQVRALAAALGDSNETAVPFDAERMTELEIYPFGWNHGAREWVLGALADLKRFYAAAAAERRAVLTCLV